MRIPDNVDFRKYISIVGELEAQEIHPAGYWADKVHEMAKGPKVWGDRLPWSKTHNLFRLRPGEITLWAGINGHKKSLMLGQIMLWLSRYRKVAIASLEMYPEQTLWRMCRQAAGGREGAPSTGFIDAFNAFVDRNVLIYDQLDNVPTDKILGFVHYCGLELKCQHIVIDSLQKCGVKNDIDAENDFINRLAWAAKHLKCHIHLVHHVRKPGSSNHSDFRQYRPDKFDIKGSGALTDLVDNVAIVWADEKRAAIKESLANGGEGDESYLAKSSDQELIIGKQRHGEWEGFFRLWFHPSGQFIPEDKGAMDFEMTTIEEAA